MASFIHKNDHFYFGLVNFFYLISLILFTLNNTYKSDAKKLF